MSSIGLKLMKIEPIKKVRFFSGHCMIVKAMIFCSLSFMIKILIEAHDELLAPYVCANVAENQYYIHGLPTCVAYSRDYLAECERFEYICSGRDETCDFFTILKKTIVPFLSWGPFPAIPVNHNCNA